MQRVHAMGERLDSINAWKMVRRCPKAAGITTEVSNHTFRGTGITAYLENGGSAPDGAHASTRTTQLYDRRADRVTLDEVVPESGSCTRRICSATNPRRGVLHKIEFRPVRADVFSGGNP
jgi:hypothetical protein